MPQEARIRKHNRLWTDFLDMSRKIVTLSEVRRVFGKRHRRVFDVLEALADLSPSGLTANEIRAAIGYRPQSDHLRVTLERMAGAHLLERSDSRPYCYAVPELELSILLSAERAA